MNKKLLYIFMVLVAGLFVISACNLIKQEEVGARAKKAEAGGVYSKTYVLDVGEGVGNQLFTMSVISVDVNGKSCEIEYNSNVYTINKGSVKTMPDGINVGVTNVFVSKIQRKPDACEIVVSY